MFKSNKYYIKIIEYIYFYNYTFLSVIEDVLYRIIKIILFLTAGNTGLRGHEGSKKKSELITEGHFIRT
jgi:hypothetical protein